jgi:hypothetical protein
VKLDFPQNREDYLLFKSKLSKTMWIYNLLVTLLVLCLWPHAVLPYIKGALLGYVYLFSLFVSAEWPSKGMAIALFFIRMLTVSFLIVWFGQFTLYDTCVLGFLSYKIVLTLEFVRYSVGINQNSGS